MAVGLRAIDFRFASPEERNPEMGIQKFTRRRRPTLVTMASFYVDQTPGDDELVIPEDLSTLSRDELEALTTRATEAFDAAYGEDGSDLDDDAFAAVEQLATGIKALRAELAVRDQAAADRQAAAAALAAEVRPADEETPAEDETPAADEETPAEEEAPAPAEEPESVVAAAAARGEQRIALSSIGRRAPRRTPEPEAAPEGIAEFMVASGEGMGVAVGAPLDFHAAGVALNQRLKTVNEGAYRAAAHAGRPMRSQMPFLQLNRPIDPELQILNPNDRDHIESIFARAGDETRLPQGSLVAAGGWCAPSQTMYDFFDDGASRDGLLTLPEVGVPRGGLNFTPGVDFADIYALVAANAFSFTEEQDVDGEYAAPNVTAWASGATIATGDFRSVNGAILRALDGGTTGASAPVVPPIGGTVVDNPGASQITWQRVGRATPNVAGDKPCFRLECPEFEEYRLDVDGLCISAGLLASKGYPEALADGIRKTLIAHDHLMNAKQIAQMAAGSTAVTLPATQAGTAAPVLTAIELQVEHYRYSRRLSRATTLEAVLPYWIRGAIRSDLSRRLGVDLISVPNERIDAWFRERGISPQFVYNWQPIDVQTAAQFNAWPTSVSFLLYQAGTWIRGAADVITVDTLYDSTLLAQNDFTALFTEEGWFVAKRGFDSRLVTTSLTADGATHVGVEIAHNGTTA